MKSKKYLFKLWITIGLAVLSVAPLSAQILINEVSASNSTVILDEDGDSPDWIELLNISDLPVELGGFFISDDPDEPTKYSLPPTSLAPGEFTLLFASDKDRAGRSIYWDSIIRQGDSTKYIVPESNVPEQWVLNEFDDSEWINGTFGIGYGDGDDSTEIANNTISVFTRSTFTIEDTSTVTEMLFHIDYDDGYIAFLNGVEISRASITGTNPVPYNQGADSFTEPKLVFGEELDKIDLKEYKSLLKEGENVLAIQLHNFNQGSSDLTLIPFLTIGFSAEPQNFRGADAVTGLSDLQVDYPHTNFKLSSSGESVVLSNADSIEIDQITYPELFGDESYGWSEAKSELLIFTEPTPGEANDTQGYSGRSTLPELTVPGGFYEGSFQVSLTDPSAGSVTRYTLDGSIPTDSSEVFGSGSIEINSTSVLKVRNLETDRVPGEVVVESYFINENHDLPVLTVSTHPDNLWSDESGIYVVGTNGIPGNGHEGANWNQPWEIPVHFELYEKDGAKSFSVGAGAKIFGKWSRLKPMKSLSIFFRGLYGTSALEYQMFSDKNIDSFQSLVLRNSGNDFTDDGFSMFRDGLMTTLMSSEDIEYQEFRPAVVYLNGEYWGIHNIREKINEHFIAANSGVDPDNIDVVESGSSQPLPFASRGTLDNYNNLISFVSENDLNDPAKFAELETIVDVENYIDYMAAQIYYANKDWPGNNIKLWRSREVGGKWRWILYDTDFGFALSYGGQVDHNTLSFALEENGPGWPNPPWSTILFREMVESEDFKTRFVNRLSDLMNSNFKPSFVETVIDSLARLIESEIPRHMANETRSGSWGGTVNEWYDEIALLKYFANNRSGFMESFVTQPENEGGKFAFGERKPVKITNSNNAYGYVRVNRLDVHAASWIGQYFSETTIPVTAIAEPGYRFVGWTGDITSQSETIEVGAGVELVANFEASNIGQDLVINEIMYHPDDANDSEDWVEIYNPGSAEVDLSGFVLKDEDNSHAFIFPESTTIGADGYLVVAKDITLFNSIHTNTENVIGDLGFGLSGNSDEVRLYNIDGLLVDSLKYDDEAPWPVQADGSGYSLELIDSQSDNSLAANWRASTHLNGSPGIENGMSVSSEEDPSKPTQVTLHQNYPNPFNPSTVISFEIPKQEHVSLKVYSISGQLVATITDAQYAAGRYNMRWNAENNASGIYFYLLRVGDETFSKKMTLIK